MYKGAHLREVSPDRTERAARCLPSANRAGRTAWLKERETPVFDREVHTLGLLNAREQGMQVKRGGARHPDRASSIGCDNVTATRCVCLCIRVRGSVLLLLVVSGLVFPAPPRHLIESERAVRLRAEWAGLLAPHETPNQPGPS